MVYDDAQQIDRVRLRPVIPEVLGIFDAPAFDLIGGLGRDDFALSDIGRTARSVALFGTEALQPSPGRPA